VTACRSEVRSSPPVWKRLWDVKGDCWRKDAKKPGLLLNYEKWLKLIVGAE
jgi:hypothetical protein